MWITMEYLDEIERSRKVSGTTTSSLTPSTNPPITTSLMPIKLKINDIWYIKVEGIIKKVRIEDVTKKTVKLCACSIDDMAHINYRYKISNVEFVEFIENKKEE